MTHLKKRSMTGHIRYRSKTMARLSATSLLALPVGPVSGVPLSSMWCGCVDWERWVDLSRERNYRKV
jgi:hypothetical protein